MQVSIVANASSARRRWIEKLARDCCSLASISGRCNLWSATPLRWFSLVTASVGCRPPNVGRDVCSATICPPYTESRVSNGAQLYARSPFRCNAHDWAVDGKNSTRLYRFQERFSEFDAHTSCQFTVLKQFLMVFPLYTVLEIAVISIPRFLHFRPIIFPPVLYLHYLPRTVWLRFWFLDHCSFFPAHRRNSKNVYTRIQYARARANTRVYSKAYIRRWLASQAVWICEIARLGGKRSLRANRCLKRAVEDLPVSTELSLPSSFVRLYLFSIPLSSPFFSSISIFTTLFIFLPTIIVTIIIITSSRLRDVQSCALKKNIHLFLLSSKILSFQHFQIFF